MVNDVKRNAPQPKVILMIAKHKAYETNNQEGKIWNHVQCIRYTWKGKDKKFLTSILNYVKHPPKEKYVQQQKLY